MLDLSCVSTFVAVVESRSVSAAAEHLALSQSGVSQQLSRLEAILGVSLVHRGRKACTPSAQGLAFLPFARGLIALEARARAAAGANRMTIGASGNIAVYLLPAAMRQFSHSSQGRGVEIEVSVGTNPEIIDRHRKRGARRTARRAVGVAAHRGAACRKAPLRGASRGRAGRFGRAALRRLPRSFR